MVLEAENAANKNLLPGPPERTVIHSLQGRENIVKEEGRRKNAHSKQENAASESAHPQASTPSIAYQRKEREKGILLWRGFI